MLLISQFAYLPAQDVPEMIKLTFDVDDAARVEISINGEVHEDLQTGINNVEINPWSNLRISAAEGCVLKSVTDSAGESLGIFDNSYSTFIGDNITEETYTIITAEESGVTFSIEVDNPSKVSCSTCAYTPLRLSEGINEFTLSSTALPIIIGPATYGQELYSVTMDGEPQPYNYGYLVTPNEGSVILITADFPDKNCTVEFTAAEGIRNFFTAIEVNSEQVADFTDGITVKCGDQVKLFFNQYCWQTADEGTPVKVTINGVETSWFGPGYSFVVKDNTVVNVEQAVPAEMIEVTIAIDNTRNVVVYNGSEWFKDVIVLKEGSNVVELPKEYATITITAVEDPVTECRIEGVTVNGRPKNVDYYNYMELNDLDAGDVIVIYTTGFTTTGIEAVATDGLKGGEVFDMCGRRVASGTDDIRKLPKGIYVAAGKKIMVK